MKTAGYVGSNDAVMKSWMSHIWQRYFDARKETDVLALDYFEKSLAYSRYKHPNLFYGFAEDWIKNGSFYRRRSVFPVVICHSIDEILNTTLDIHKLLNNVPSVKEKQPPKEELSDSTKASELLLKWGIQTSYVDPREPKLKPPTGYPTRELDESFFDDLVPAETDPEKILKDLELTPCFGEFNGEDLPAGIRQNALELDYLAELLFTCQTTESFAKKAADTALYNLSSPVTAGETVIYSVVKRLVEIAAIAALHEWTVYLEDLKWTGKPHNRLTWYFYKRLSDVVYLLTEGDGKERNKIARRSDNHIWLWIPNWVSEFNSMLRYARDTDGVVRKLLNQIYDGKTETLFEKTKPNTAFMGGSAEGTVLLLNEYSSHRAAYLPWVINTLANYQDSIFIALELDKWTETELELLEKAVSAVATDNLFIWTAADNSRVPESFKNKNVMTSDEFNSELMIYPAPKFISYTEKVLSEMKEDQLFLNQTAKAERLKKLYREESELIIGNLCAAEKTDKTTNLYIPYEEMPENLIVKARRLIFKINGEDSEKANHPYKCTGFK